MRTSRGLQVTSLVVLSPVVLILLSLLTILTTTLFSQLQLWYPSIYTSSPSLSKWVSTATTTTTINNFGYGSNDSLFLQTDDTNTTAYFSTSNTANSNTSPYRPQSMIHVWLKRWRHLKRKSPSLWTLCGLVLLLGYVYLFKSHVQKRQASRYLLKLASYLTRGFAYVVTCCGKQTMIFWKDHVAKNDLTTAEDILWMDDDNQNTKSGYMKHKQPNARAAIVSSTHQRHNTKKVKKQQHRQRSSSIKQSSVPASSNKQQQVSPVLSKATMDEEEAHVDLNDWISVGDNKKKKDSVQPTNEHEDYDDDDKTMVDELDATPSKANMMMMMETPTTSDDDETESLGSPCNSKTDIHHYEPVIRNWYSPFSTGLDLDILPREDPLVMLDPMQLRKYNKHENDYPCDNFSLLQNHPFVINEQQKRRLQLHRPLSMSSPPLGAIGQHYPSTYSSPVQNSNQHPFSLFI